MGKEFDQKEYIKEYRKNKYKQFKTEMPVSEKEEIDKFIKDYNLSKLSFIREGFELMKEKYENRKYYVKASSYYCQKKGKTWYYGGDTTFNNIDTDLIFDNIDEANIVYNNIQLEDHIQDNTRYSDYKQLYAIDNDIDDVDDIDIDEAQLIKDEYTFLDYK